MGKLIKFMNAIVIINVIIVLVWFFIYIYEFYLTPPTSGWGGLAVISYLFRLVGALCILYILAAIHISIIADEGKHIISAYVRDLKYMGFRFTGMLIMKCVQMLIFIVVFDFNIRYSHTYNVIPLWDLWFGTHIVGMLTSFMFVKYFWNLGYKPIPFLLWIYTAIPVIDIKVLALLRRTVKNQGENQGTAL